MTRKRRRLVVVLLSVGILGLAAALVLNAFEDSLVFFHSPSDLVEKPVPPGRTFRLGGLVEEGSYVKQGVDISFNVTDLAESIPVKYRGLVPDLFREGQGVVAEGQFDENGTFVASNVLAKHDENYMPPEVAESLKEAGHWQEQAGDE
ncbi:cytochrome c maturation protein CcmE [Sneathiella glossodoripedis]|uniref:cytochrome c maturation protein CcmE n=1 Tax=Sneathiella glossodoripedis TaxID=418853 RepID=UPI00046F4989|nr:cytochrome c maturation protein CcmE [Sneathiella glossodoripedis]